MTLLMPSLAGAEGGIDVSIKDNIGRADATHEHSGRLAIISSTKKRKKMKLDGML